ncbi:MAG TPA: hypothetical protein VG318_09540 [Actinomycetota bacterium]|nr:hypothetical protein [Actinomycetota bacterium]
MTAARFRKTTTCVLAGALVAGALVVPAAAKKKAKPVPTTLYMHGASLVGEADSSPQVADVPLPMDPNEPEGAEPKSHGIANGVVTPNHRCAGNNLFPVFVGDVKGQIVGDMKVTLHAVATPGKVDVRVWTDKIGLLCTSDVSGSAEYPEPAGEVTLDLPAGHGVIEAVFEDLNVLATTNLMIQVSPQANPVATPAGDRHYFAPFVARVLYDAVDYASNVEFSCIPPKGATSCAS